MVDAADWQSWMDQALLDAMWHLRMTDWYTSHLDRTKLLEKFAEIRRLITEMDKYVARPTDA